VKHEEMKSMDVDNLGALRARFDLLDIRCACSGGGRVHVVTCPRAAGIHGRMPAILAPADYARWLSTEPDPHELMRPFPAALMRMWPISTVSTSPRTTIQLSSRSSRRPMPPRRRQLRHESAFFPPRLDLLLVLHDRLGLRLAQHLRVVEALDKCVEVGPLEAASSWNFAAISIRAARALGSVAAFAASSNRAASLRRSPVRSAIAPPRTTHTAMELTRTASV
jgi:hypothetical protein